MAMLNNHRVDIYWNLDTSLWPANRPSTFCLSSRKGKGKIMTNRDNNILIIDDAQQIAPTTPIVNAYEANLFTLQ
jgi:hypothetical protein